MAECPHCEYNKKRAQNWRVEAYKLSGHPLPRKETMTEEDDDIQDYKKPWVDLTKEECFELCAKHKDEPFSLLVAVQDKLRSKNYA